MASNLACLGLGVETEDEFTVLVDRALRQAVPIATAGEERLLRWQDPSGARLLFTMGAEGIRRLTPSLSADPGGHLTAVRKANEDVAIADVHQDGDTVTRLSIELEEIPLLGDGTYSGPANVVALGVAASVHEDAEAFGASDESILGDPDRKDEPRPENHPDGHPWPPRLAGESFMAYGMFGPADETTANAWLAGTVLRAERRTTQLTQQEFIVARVRTVGFEADVCLPGTAHLGAPGPGNVIAGEMFLVGSLQLDVRAFAERARKKRWFTRR